MCSLDNACLGAFTPCHQMGHERCDPPSYTFLPSSCHLGSSQKGAAYHGDSAALWQRKAAALLLRCVWEAAEYSIDATWACHAGDAVTDGTMLLWKGFVSLILGAYFEKRMAWYPVVRPTPSMLWGAQSAGTRNVGSDLPCKTHLWPMHAGPTADGGVSHDRY